MKTRLLAIFIAALICLTVTGAAAQSVAGVPGWVETPKDLAKWLGSEFEYRFEMVDKWDTKREIIDSKKGDCEDFAMLASDILSGWGIDNQLVVVRFKDLDIGHAICVWKNENGTYSFITNTQMKNTGKRSIEEAVARYYPDWESIERFDGKMKYSGRIARNI